MTEALTATSVAVIGGVVITAEFIFTLNALQEIKTSIEKLNERITKIEAIHTQSSSDSKKTGKRILAIEEEQRNYQDEVTKMATEIEKLVDRVESVESKTESSSRSGRRTKKPVPKSTITRSTVVASTPPPEELMY